MRRASTSLPALIECMASSFVTTTDSLGPAMRELLRRSRTSIRFRANRRAPTASADTSAHARTQTGYGFTSTPSAVATHQRNCRSSGKVLNLKIVLDWFSGAISPMAKCWTTTAGHASRGRRRAKVSGVREGVAPEGTPQRLCPHSPVLSKNDGWPTTKSVAMLASPMQ